MSNAIVADWLLAASQPKLLIILLAQVKLASRHVIISKNMAKIHKNTGWYKN